MAGAAYIGAKLYNKTGETLIYTYGLDANTVQYVLNSQQATASNISEVANTVGGQTLSSNTSLEDIYNRDDGYAYLYDVTPASAPSCSETIALQIERLQDAKAAIKTSIESKGVIVPSSAKLDTYDDYIDSIPTGTEKRGRTFTITRTETSDPAQFNPRWSDDAAGLTAGSTAFDAFFGYSGVRLSAAGKETAWTGQTQPGTLDITKLGTLTSGDNVMIKFPVRGIRMTKSGNNVTLSITDELDKDGYQYYAFTRNGKICTNLYLGAYLGSRVSNVLKSWSGQSPSSSMSTNGISYIPMQDRTSDSPVTLGARSLARANDGGDGTGTHGYEVMTWYARVYINALYMMKYGNPKSQTVIGTGYEASEYGTTTGGTNSRTSATYGTSSTSSQMKLFGLEDYHGNLFEWLDGAYCPWTQKLEVSTTGTLTNTSRSTGSFDTTITRPKTGNYIKSIVGDNIGTFVPSDSSGSETTYYCARYERGATGVLMGSRSGYNGVIVSLLSMTMSSDPLYPAYQFGARLMYL